MPRHIRMAVNCGHTDRRRHALGLCQECYLPLQREMSKEWHQIHKSDPGFREAHNARTREFCAKLKLEVLTYYSLKGHLSCSCPNCDVVVIDFLNIDHINGEGIQHRKVVGGGGRPLYVWLKRNGFPNGFQTLCWNCNSSKGLFGSCYHERVKDHA
jgi:hypothetical protein